LEKPPAERDAPVSGAIPVVPPTTVTYGQPEGKETTNLVQLDDWVPETPPSPEAYRMLVPRAPICA
jgi:hypothetical protein